MIQTIWPKQPKDCFHILNKVQPVVIMDDGRWTLQCQDCGKTWSVSGDKYQNT